MSTEIRKLPIFRSAHASAFGLWTRLPFLATDEHVLPNLDIIAKDGQLTRSETAELMDELCKVGLVELLADDSFRLTTLSQQFYSFTEPQEEDEA
jgi:hypothetical protein